MASSRSYTSNSMISPRRKRKGPAPPPPTITSTFNSSFSGHSGINVSPLSSKSHSSASSPSSLAVTPTHSPPPLPGPSTSTLSTDTKTPPPILSTSQLSSSTSSNNNDNNENILYSGPSTSGLLKVNDNSSNTFTTGRKKSIKTKPAPSPPPPLPSLPPLASRPKSVTQGALSPTLPKPKINGTNPSSPEVIVHAPCKSLSSPRKPSHTPRSPSSSTSPHYIPTCSNTHHNCRPVTLKCLPCRAHLVPVCPISTLTRSLSDQKQINGKHMLKSVASYSSDLNLPKFTRVSGLITNDNSPTGFNEKRLESDSIIITYDDSDYIYQLMGDCYSSVEIPHSIGNVTNASDLVPSRPPTPMRKKRQQDEQCINKSQSYTILPTKSGVSSPLGRPPRPPSPKMSSNSYRIINRSTPQIPHRNRRKNRPDSFSMSNYCSLDSCCKSDPSANFKIVPTLPSKSSSLVHMRPRSAPSTPCRNVHGSRSLPKTNSTLTLNQDKTLSNSLSGSSNHNCANGLGCSTATCSLCSLNGGQTEQRPLKSSTMTLNRESENRQSSLDEPIYEEIDFGIISEDVAALLSPKQLINSANNKRHTWQGKSSTIPGENGEMLLNACNNSIDITPIETIRGEAGRLPCLSGTTTNTRGDGGGSCCGVGQEVGNGHQTNLGGEILSDTSDDRVTVKSMSSHNNNNQLKPWAYSSSSLDSEQSTTSSGSTVKQWANQIVSYPSNGHHFTNHHVHQHQHHSTNHENDNLNQNHLHGGSSRGSSSVTSSTSPSSCYHGNHSTLYRIQGIGQKYFQQHHHHSHHNHHQQQHGVDDDVDGEEVEKENDQHLHSHQLHGHLPHHQHHHHPFDPYHPHLASSSATSSGKQYHQCYHCQNHYHPHHHYRHYYQHHGHQMITTSTSDHSLSSLSSSNFSEDPATPTPLNLMIAPHDDYNLTFLSDDLSSSAGHHCPDLDETNEDEIDDDDDDDNIDVTVDEDDVEEEEVMIFDEILFRGDAKNEFGKSSCCYSDPFYRILDLNGDEQDDDDEDDETRDAQDDDDANTISNEMREEKKTQEDRGKLTSKPEIGSTSSPRLKYIKSGQLPPSTNAAITVNKKTKSLSSLIYHRFNCDSIVNNNQSPCHCHQCYHHHHHYQQQQQQQQQHPRHHLIATKAYHQHLINNYQQLNKTINKSGNSGSKDNIIMASSWDGDGHFTGGGDTAGGGGNNNISSGPFVGDHQPKQTQTQNHTHHHETSNSYSNDENNINRLMQELQLAISYGQHRKAALLARQLALRKVSCSFNQSTANGTANDDQPIIVYLYIEDRQSRHGPFPIQLCPSMTVRMLKQKVEGDFGFPVNLQSWILGKCLATNEDALLSTFGITLSGCPIFLYLLSNSNTIDHQVTINESQNGLGQSIPAAAVATTTTATTLTQSLGEKTQHDGDGDGDEMENNKNGGNHGDDQNENQVNTQLILTNDSKEEMKGGKRRSFSMAGNLLASTGENGTINEIHAGLNQDNNEKKTDPMVEVKPTLSASSSSSSFKSFTTISSLGHFKTNAETNSLEINGNINELAMDVKTPAVKTFRRHKSAKSMASSSSSSSTTSSTSSSTFKTPSCSPSTSKSSSKSFKTHGETRNNNRDNSHSESHEKLHGGNGESDEIPNNKVDKIPIEPSKRQHRKIHSITNPNDNKMMATSNDENLAFISASSSASTSDTKRPVNDNMIIQQSNNLIKSEQNQGDNDNDDYDDDDDNNNNKSTGNNNDDNKSNGSNKMTEMIGQQVEGDYNQLEILQSKGQITDTYKLLMELDDVDLVKNSQEFECPICFINIPSDEGVVLRDCLHTFCRECLCNAIEFCDDAIVKCPYRGDEYACDSTITDREIKSLASNDLYLKYLARSMKAAELRIEKSFHCKTADCPGWCEFDDNVNTFPCPVCGKVNCLTCQAIHENINCRQYQDTLSSEAAESNEDAKATKQFLDNMLDKGEALRCPVCFVILIKKWGCDWVKCSMCQSEICWVTKGPRWGPGGKGDISGGCKCMINGQKCHPKCNYCH